MLVEPSLSWIVHENKIIIIIINTVKQYIKFRYLKCDTFSWIFVYLVLWRLKKWLDNSFCYVHTIKLKASTNVNEKKMYTYICIYVLWLNQAFLRKLLRKLFDNNFCGCFELVVGTLCTLKLTPKICKIHKSSTEYFDML